MLKKQGYDKACDIWSLGILLHTMQVLSLRACVSEHVLCVPLCTDVGA